MPAKWQQWMPFRIDAFKSSPAVQAMHPSARSGYLYLLSCAWQTEDCTIPDEPLDLAEMSGLGDELWSLHGPRILRKFGVLECGRRRNEALYADWLEAKRIFEARKDAANRTNSVRSPRHLSLQSPNGHRVAVPAGPLRSADTRTGTGTITGTEELPPVPAAGSSKNTDEAHMIASAVIEGTKITSKWIRVQLEEQAKLCLSEKPDDMDGIRDAMVDSWKRYQQCAKDQKLRTTPMSAEKFFGDGLWRTSAMWGLKNGASAYGGAQ